MKYDLNFDYDNKAYKIIFNDTSRPFSERLDTAVLLANKRILQKIKQREMFRLWATTGVIFIDSSMRNPNQTT